MAKSSAGKSLLVTSLELLAGKRASAELVRTGDERLRVEGWFSVDRGSNLDAVLDDIGADDRFFEMGAPRVTTSLKLGERRDKGSSMKAKVASVREKMGAGG